MIRTKIVATMGPACSDVQTLHDLFEAGLDICRLNFSHGDLPTHLATLKNIHQAAVRSESPIGVLGDLCGPKIRLGPIDDIDGKGGMPIDVGDTLVIQRQPIQGRDKRVSATYRELIDDVKVGDRLLIEDGLLRFVITEKSPLEIHCNCLAGGVLKTAKGINLPNTRVNLPAITERDWQCVDWAIENDLDYLALSFVRHAGDIEQLREHLRNHKSDIQIIAKIEKSEAIAEIDAIIEAADGLMIARGDLGVEMDVAQVPLIQKDLVKRCQAAGKPVIVATQMLQSMIESSSPTRAEVSDVANAIFDGTDAVMLSGETSVGKFPVGAVLVMAHVADTTEQYIFANPSALQAPMRVHGLQYSAAIAAGVRRITEELTAKLVVVYSQTGATARIFSKSRLVPPIVALSSNHRALRRMALHWGVLPLEMTEPANLNDLVQRVDRLVIDRKFAEVGDRVVIVSGASLGTPATLSGVIVHTVSAEESNP